MIMVCYKGTIFVFVGNNEQIRIQTKTKKMIDTNFCNIFNLLRDGNKEELNYDITSIEYDSCTWKPTIENNNYTDAYQTCDTY